jgi:hypothetical protein
MIKKLQARMKNELSLTSILGLIILSAILLFMATSKLGDSNQVLKLELQNSQRDLLTLQELQADKIWDKRLEKTETKLASLDAKTWQGPTSGVVAAYLEERLTQILTTAKAERPLIRVDSTPMPLDGIQIMSFEMRGSNISHAAAIDLVVMIEDNVRQIWYDDVLTSFNINGKATVSIKGVIPIKIDQPPVRDQ